MVLTLVKYRIKVVTPKMIINSQKQASGKKKMSAVEFTRPFIIPLSY